MTKRTTLSPSDMMQLKWLMHPEKFKMPVPAPVAVRFLGLGLAQHTAAGLAITDRGKQELSGARAE